MPTYLFLVMMAFAPTVLSPLQYSSMLRVLVIVFIATFVLPALSIGTFRASEFITDMRLISRRERMLPFAFTTLFYGITAYLFYKKLHINDVLYMVFACTTVLLALITTITHFWKVSVHGAAMGGALGIMLAIAHKMPVVELFYPLVGATVITGFVASARLQLNAHDPAQVYAGVATGAVVCYVFLIIAL
jgi:uncharacterized protein YqgC (DUF456 family)